MSQSAHKPHAETRFAAPVFRYLPAFFTGYLFTVITGGIAAYAYNFFSGPAAVFAGTLAGLALAIVGYLVNLFSAELKARIKQMWNLPGLMYLTIGLMLGVLPVVGLWYVISRPHVFSQSAPGCSNPPGAVWNKALPGTQVQCSSAGLLMAGGSNYAEYDLDQINGASFDQTSFDVSVDARFTSAPDPSAAAALLVQTPQSSQIGGYNLVVQANGDWALQEPLTIYNMNPVDSGHVTLDPSRPVKLRIVVKQHVLYGYINGQQVTQQADTQNPSPGAIGLMVQWSGQDASPRIVFSNFDLTVAR